VEDCHCSCSSVLTSFRFLLSLQYKIRRIPSDISDTTDGIVLPVPQVKPELGLFGKSLFSVLEKIVFIYVYHVRLKLTPEPTRHPATIPDFGGQRVHTGFVTGTPDYYRPCGSIDHSEPLPHFRKVQPAAQALDLMLIGVDTLI
jgi:hypothetical protein